MFSDTRFFVFFGGCIAALLMLTGCNSDDPTPKITVETIGVSEQIEEKIVAVETVNAAQPTVEQPPDGQQGDQVTDIGTASPSEEAIELPIEVDAVNPQRAGPGTTYLGDVVEVGGVFISATKLIYPAELENYWPPKEGEKLVAIDAVIGVTNRDSDHFSLRELSLVDKEGFTYSTEIPRLAWPELYNAKLYRGEKARFLVVFKIPEKALPTILKYDNWWLAVGLGEPPDGHISSSTVLNVPLIEPESKLGETFNKSGYSISAQSVRDPIEPHPSYTPEPGEKLVGVDVIIALLSAEDYLPGVSPYNFYLIDNFGYRHDPEVGSIDDEIHSYRLLNGDHARGWVAFSIPEEASPYIIRCWVGYGSGYRWVENLLETGLIE